MYSNDFEEKFDAFLENRAYDTAEEAVFHLVRAAFIAGWEAAGGEPSGQYRLFEVTGSRKPARHPRRRRL